MASPVWFRELLKHLFPARFLLARATRVPLLGRLIDLALFNGDDIYYLPDNRVVEINATLPPPGDTVLPSAVAEHFVKTASRRFIMHSCLCRDAAKCEDYPTNLGCVFLGESTTRINPAFGREATVEEALAHLEKCREAGLVHLVGRNKLDAVWMNAWPKERLMTICHCCPCCCLWRVLPVIDQEVGRKVQRLPGVSVRVGDECVGCGVCERDACFVDAISVVEGRAVISDQCRGCGRCATLCPQQAIEVVFEDPDAVDQVVGRLSRLVDLG
ncbi:MAG: DUF362 domain-containing protein [Desulfatibacillaceae bacterium]